MTKLHPYEGLPDYSRWTRSISGVPYTEVDPVVGFPFRIKPAEKLATAGSCFAQHIARHLREKGFNYLVVEDGHPIGSRELRQMYNYGTFSARYGNIYTTRQLLQLIQRAFDGAQGAEDHWMAPDGGYLDPLRPSIQPRPFATLDEMHADRAQHLAAVRRMFEEMDYFVFTLGLTEAWVSATNGTVFPVCPGVAGGRFDPNEHKFHNFTYDEVRGDLNAALARIRAINSRAKIILTVSPVPLVATAEAQHVLVSTTYSKSVLRVVCADVVRANDSVAYFPSYEIITGNFNRGRYFGPDLRTVTEEGVSHVMRLFMTHAAEATGIEAAPPSAPSEDEMFAERALHGGRVVCEEELIELAASANS